MRKWFLIVPVSLVVLVGGYILAHLALIEIGREVVIVHKSDTKHTRLWVVDEAGYAWVHHCGFEDEWIRSLATDPLLMMERVGEVRQYHALPVQAAHRHIHQLLREKYGFADRWVRWLAGTDEQRGLLGLCEAVPVRLERL
jgi:hypothetical protein